MSAYENKKLNQKEDEVDTFFQYFFNPQKKTIFGRSGADCFRLTVFYIILYIILAAFWMLMLLIFYQTLDERVPKYTLEESRIGSNPGLGFRPRPREEYVDSTLIWFKNGANEGSWRYWSNSLEKFLEPYQKATDQTGAHIQKCSGAQGWAGEGKFCYFDIKDIDNNCTKQNDFGYRRGDPCVLLKLNRIFNWRPEPFSADDLATSTYIPESVKQQYPKRSDASQLIYITCEGEVCFRLFPMFELTIPFSFPTERRRQGGDRPAGLLPRPGHRNAILPVQQPARLPLALRLRALCQAGARRAHQRRVQGVGEEHQARSIRAQRKRTL